MRNEASVARSSTRLLGPMVALCLTALMASGCGDPNRVENMSVYPVTGKVLLKDDKPLTSGNIVFTLQGRGLPFTSPIGSDGTFTMKSQFGDGIPEGSYLVRIEPDPSTAPVAPGKKASGKSAWPFPFPEMYGDETTSGLTATVKPGENKLEPFKLVPHASGGHGRSGKAGGRNDE